MDSSTAWNNPGHWTIMVYQLFFIENKMQMNKTIVLSSTVACLLALFVFFSIFFHWSIVDL